MRFNHDGKQSGKRCCPVPLGVGPNLGAVDSQRDKGLAAKVNQSSLARQVLVCSTPTLSSDLSGQEKYGRGWKQHMNQEVRVSGTSHK